MTPRDGRLGVGIVGAGRVGPVLGAALGGAGHAVVGISTVSQDGRDRADALLPGVPVLELPVLLERSELVLLAIPATEIADLVAGLAAVGAWQPGQLVVHTAPEFGVGVLGPARATGAIPLAIHPIMSFTGTSVDLVRLRESWCAVTAPGPVLPIAQALVVELGAEPLVIAEEDRPAYAEAIETAASYSAALTASVLGKLRDVGVEEPGSVVGPLIRSAVENALTVGAPARPPAG